MVSAFLPLLSFLAIYLAVLQWCGDTRMSALRAAVLWGVFASISIEILSLFQWITFTAIFIFWTAVILIVVSYLLFRQRGGERITLPSLTWPLSWSERLMFVVLGSIVVVTGVIAWFAPPNTWDALNYHMPRVAQWAQQGSLVHFATGIEFQNYLPPGASLLVLHMYILGQGDQWVNFIQWFAMLGSLIGVSYIARQLGVGRFGQWAAALFAATLPMGILQATSAVNDYVVAFWIVCVAAEFLDMEGKGISNTNLIFMAGAAGLALLTKHTSIPYLLPFAFVVAVLFVQRRALRGHLAGVLIGLALVAALNFSYLYRNYQTYGSIAGPGERVGNQTTQTFDPRALLSNVMRNASLQAGTPSRYVNKAIAIGITWLHERVGIDVNDPRTTSEGVFRVKPPITHETVASNPIQAYFLLIAGVYLINQRKKLPRAVLGFSGLALGGFLILSMMFKWKVTGARYHLPFFVLAAPVAGMVLQGWRRRWAADLMLGLFFVGAIPALITNPSRPLFNGVKGAEVGSVLLEPRHMQYFANAGYEAKPYLDIIGIIQDESCTSVGIMLPGGEIEYQIWALLGSPRSDLQIEWIVSDTPSARYADPDFKPCALICLECPEDWEAFSGLPEVYKSQPFRLFADTVK